MESLSSQMSKVATSHLVRGSFNFPFPGSSPPHNHGNRSPAELNRAVQSSSSGGTSPCSQTHTSAGHSSKNPTLSDQQMFMQMPYFPNNHPFGYPPKLPFPAMKSHPPGKTIMTLDSPPDRDAIEQQKTRILEEIRATTMQSPSQSTNPAISEVSGAFFHCAEPGCSKVFTTAATLSKHVQTHTGERPFECSVPFCGKSFKTATYLSRHLKVHNIHMKLSPEDEEAMKYKCSYDGCERSFTNKHALHRHMDTHSTERPFTCLIPNCGKTFKTKGSLKQHGKCHTQAVAIDQTPFKCTSMYCGKAFNTKGQLKIHLETHIYPGLRPYVCTVEGCSKAFKSKGSLRQHEVCHRDDRPYICTRPGCEKMFKTTVCRDQHVKTHKVNLLLSTISPPSVTDLQLPGAPSQRTPEHLKNCIVDQRNHGNYTSEQPVSPDERRRNIAMEHLVDHSETIVACERGRLSTDSTITMGNHGQGMTLAGERGRLSSDSTITMGNHGQGMTLAGERGRLSTDSTITMGNHGQGMTLTVDGRNLLSGPSVSQAEHCGNAALNHFMSSGLGNIAVSH